MRGGGVERAVEAGGCLGAWMGGRGGLERGTRREGREGCGRVIGSVCAGSSLFSYSLSVCVHPSIDGSSAVFFTPQSTHGHPITLPRFCGKTRQSLL